MPLASLSAKITAAGISAPSYVEILQSLQDSFRIIYGSDAYIAPDSQDGQLLAIMAAAINDNNQTAIAVYNAFSPTFAQGAGLSSVVKINGIRRLSSSYSTAVGTVVGVAGTIITNGSVKDQNGNVWNLPSPTTIPVGGSISVTVTSQAPGAIAALSGTIDNINTPTFGWQTFTSTADAAVGQPVETDAALRRRQSQSQSIAAITPLQALYAAVANLDGVTRTAAYENDTGSVDANGLPAHSISMVVLGGDSQEIAETIGQKKTPGAATYGSTTEPYTDPVTGISYDIDYYVLGLKVIKVVVTGTAMAGYSTNVADEIKASVAAFINSLDIGQDVQYTRVFPAAYLNGAADSRTYEITAITIQISGVGSPGTADLVIPFNFAASCDPDADVTITIT